MKRYLAMGVGVLFLMSVSAFADTEASLTAQANIQSQKSIEVKIYDSSLGSNPNEVEWVEAEEIPGTTMNFGTLHESGGYYVASKYFGVGITATDNEDSQWYVTYNGADLTNGSHNLVWRIKGSDETGTYPNGGTVDTEEKDASISSYHIYDNNGVATSAYFRAYFTIPQDGNPTSSTPAGTYTANVSFAITSD